MASDANRGRTGALSVRPATLTELSARLGASIVRREGVRAWSMSAVERLYLDDGSTTILKYAVVDFAAEAGVLAHVAAHGAPVPRLLADKVQDDGSVVMVMEDLGEEVREAGLKDAAEAAVAVHTCPPLQGRPVLDAPGLAALPGKALDWLTALQAEGRWRDADDLGLALARVAEAAPYRAEGAKTPPYGMCHSEFHPTSLHIGASGLRVLDWARAYTGNGLLDLVSWQRTPEPLRLDAVAELIDAYVTAGGPESARADRGGLPAHVWASGWDKMWVVEWFLETTYRRADPGNDAAMTTAVRRHLQEVVECLLG